jgi:hypothetical protein
MSDNALDTSGFVSFEVGQPAEAPAPDTPAAEAAPESEAVTDPEPKPKKTVQDRISELTRARREAEREAKHWRDIAEGRGQPEAKEEAEPNADDYDYGESDPKYIRAMIDHGVKRGLDTARQEMAQQQQLQAEERAWEAAQDAARSEYPDFDEIVTEGAAEGRWVCTPEMAQVIRTSDAGGKLAYRLASNPEEARRIASLNPLSQARELGRLEASLSAKPAEPAPQPVRTTNAPTPAQTQVRGKGGQFKPAADTDDFSAFEKTYASSW